MAKTKKRKLSSDEHALKGSNGNITKPSAVFIPNGPRLTTLSVAFPGSIIANAKSHDQKTYLVGTIARALAVFCVDEVVIFEDESRETESEPDPDEYTAFSHPSHFLHHLLSYLETPPYLRRALFGMHPNLRTAGTLPSLDMPHHFRANERCLYREGVVVEGERGKSKQGSLVDSGLPEKHLLAGIEIPPKQRVTLRISPKDQTAEPVNPADPKEKGGYYWGYSVRRCLNISSVFTECPFDGGYDTSVGTSERGTPLSEVFSSLPDQSNHAIIVLGGVAGLESAAKVDKDLASKGIRGDSVSELFDYWINILPGQGSRTIRTEEAVWLSLMGLKARLTGS